MFESALLNVLKNDSELVSYVSTYKGKVSMFSNRGPENVDFPYITCSIHEAGGSDATVTTFNIFINYFDYSNSGKQARQASKRIQELLDRQHISDEYYDTIRCFMEGTDFVEGNEDPRAQQYNTKFSARAGRSGWMKKTL